MIILALLLLAGAVFLLAAGGCILGQPKLAQLALGAPVIAAAMVAQGLLADAPRAPHGAYGKVWATISAVTFDMDAIDQVKIGGDAQSDDVVVSPALGLDANRIGRGRLPQGIIVISREKGDLAIGLGPQIGPGDRAIVKIEADGRTSYLGAQLASGQTAFCVSACDSERPLMAKLAPGQVFDTAYTPSLSFTGQAEGTHAIYFTPPNSRTVMVAATGGVKDAYHLAKGTRIKVTVLEASPSVAPRGGDNGAAGRLVTQRGFYLGFDGRRLTVRLLTPETSELANEVQQRSAIKLSSAAASDQPTGVGETSAVFYVLGRPFDSDLAMIRLDVPRTSAEPAVLRTIDGGQQMLERGQTLGGARQVQLELRLLDLESGIGKYAAPFAVLALLGSLFATWRLRRQDPIAALLFGALDLTLALRLLIAVEGSFIDSGVKAQGAVAAGLIAIPFGTFIVLAAHPRALENQFGAVCMAAMTIAAIGLTQFSSAAPVDMTAIALCGLLCGVVCAVGRWPARLMAEFDHWTATDLPAPEQTAEVIESKMQPAWGVWATWALCWALVILGLRFAFSLLGWRESIKLAGVRLSLSLIFVPLTLVAAAPLMSRAAQGWRGKAEARMGAIVLLVVLLIGVLAPSHLVNDNGFAVFALPLIVAALVTVAGNAGERHPLIALTMALLAMSPMMVGGLLYLAGHSGWLGLGVAALSLPLAVGVWWFLPSAAWLAPLAATISLLLTINGLSAIGDLSVGQPSLAQAEQANTNNVRFFSVLAPARLAAFGTRTADAMQDTNSHMREYGHTLTGRGYFNLPTPTVLKPYHLSDNVSAVHLISPFGRLGAMSFLFVSGGLSALACAYALRRNRASDWLGALAALTVFLISAYMVLANLLAILFTGRNVYFLAASSSEDLLEGLTLFALIVAGLGSAAAERKDTTT